MGHPRFAKEEIARRGQEIYDQTLRPCLETPENFGKILVVDIETGEYEIDVPGNEITLAHRVLAKHPGAALFGIRIGYSSKGQIGGGWGLFKDKGTIQSL
jgi:hypothetical protein